MKKAAAVTYQKGMQAPVVTAKGQGYVAENIIEEAMKSHKPVYEDKELVTLLTELEVGEQIPEALYELVAEVLVFVTETDELYQKMGEKS